MNIGFPMLGICGRGAKPTEGFLESFSVGFISSLSDCFWVKHMRRAVLMKADSTETEVL